MECQFAHPIKSREQRAEATLAARPVAPSALLGDALGAVRGERSAGFFPSLPP